MGDEVDPRFPDRRFQEPGDAAAEQHPHVPFDQAPHPLEAGGFAELQADAAAVGIGHQDFPGHVEDGRDPALPLWYRNFHALNLANAVPNPESGNEGAETGPGRSAGPAIVGYFAIISLLFYCILHNYWAR